MRKHRPLIYYGLGLGTAMIFGALVDQFAMNDRGGRDTSPGIEIVSKEGGTVPMLSDKGVVVLEVEMERGRGKLQRIRVLREGIGAIFVYEPCGPHGKPFAQYGGGNTLSTGFVWTDLDCDGRWDERLDLSAKRLDIRVVDSWVKARPIKDSGGRETNAGIYFFEPNSGEWNR